MFKDDSGGHLEKCVFDISAGRSFAIHHWLGDGKSVAVDLWHKFADSGAEICFRFLIRRREYRYFNVDVQMMSSGYEHPVLGEEIIERRGLDRSWQASLPVLVTCPPARGPLNHMLECPACNRSFDVDVELLNAHVASHYGDGEDPLAGTLGSEIGLISSNAEDATQSGFKRKRSDQELSSKGDSLSIGLAKPPA